MQSVSNSMEDHQLTTSSPKASSSEKKEDKKNGKKNGKNNAKKSESNNAKNLPLRIKAYFFHNMSETESPEMKYVNDSKINNLHSYVTFDDIDDENLKEKRNLKRKLYNGLNNQKSVLIAISISAFFLLSTLSTIYTLIFLCRNYFILDQISNHTRNNYSNYFYAIDVQRFQDSNNDGLGDYVGIEQNINYFKMMSISTVLLQKLVVDRTEKFRSIEHLNHLIQSFHSSGIRAICDISPFIQNNSFDSIGKLFLQKTLFDAYYLSFNPPTDNVKNLLELLPLSSQFNANASHDWYIGISSLNSESIFNNTAVLLPQLNKSYIKGFIHEIDLPVRFEQVDKNSLQTFFTFLFNVHQMVSLYSHQKEHIFYIDSRETSIYGGDLFLYPYFYAAIGFSPCGLMLKAGYEFKDVTHLNRNYTEKIQDALKTGISYIEYFSSLRKARNSRFFDPPHDWTTKTWGNSHMQAFIRETNRSPKKIVAFYNLDKPTPFNLTTIQSNLNISVNLNFLHKRNEPFKTASNSSTMEHLNVYYAYLS